MSRLFWEETYALSRSSPWGRLRPGLRSVDHWPGERRPPWGLSAHQLSKEEKKAISPWI